eukprot:723326-Prymnesium_polylepis.1
MVASRVGKSPATASSAPPTSPQPPPRRRQAPSWTLAVGSFSHVRVISLVVYCCLLDANSSALGRSDSSDGEQLALL